MKGIEFAEIRDAIAGAFNADEFDMFLFERLDFDRAQQVADGPFRLIVTNVLKTAQQQGWDPILIAEVAAARPLKGDVQEVYKKYAQALVDEGRQHSVDASQLKAIEKYRLGPSVIVQTAGAPRSRAPTAVAGTEQGLERTVKPYLKFINVSVWREKLLNLEGRVCRVEIQNVPIGTGFLVGPDAVLTNYHVMRKVIDNPALSNTVKLRFDYRVLPNGTPSDGTLVSLHPTEWLIDSTPYTAGEANNNPDANVPTVDQLDFTLMKLDRAFGEEPFAPANTSSGPRGWISVPTVAPSISPAMPILILQHPNNEPLKLAVDTDGVIRLYDNGTRVRYATNTEPGSSGSPCFDIDWKLIALHHYGDPLHDQAQYNQGIPINMIRDRLKRVEKENALGGPIA